MKDIIFREYDIRGKVGSEFIIDDVPALTQAIAFFLHAKNPQLKTVAVGMDVRTHSAQIKDLMIHSLRESGIDVIFLSACPSPAVYFATHVLPIDAALMITASHNPKDYNGVKICLGTQALWGSQIRMIGDFFKEKKQLRISNESGSFSYQPINPPYIDWLVNQFASLHGLTMPVVIDCGNATGGLIMPELVKRLEWKNTYLLFAEVDGTFPHHEPDPTVEAHVNALRETVFERKAAIGIGLDGDCDRMAPMTASGFLVPGDQVLGIFAQAIAKDHPDLAVVGDIKSSSGLLELLKSLGIKGYLAPSGHALIKNAMHEHHALLAGELSCHFFFNDRYFGYDDGIYALLRLIEIMVTTGKSLDQLVATFPKTYASPEFRIPCDEDKKYKIIAAVKNQLQVEPHFSLVTIDGVRATTSYGWGLIRASHTQPVLCFRFESATRDGLTKIKKEFISLLTSYYDVHTLEQEFQL
jgi:phosphomannomutase/phosphoglucomutase